MDIKFTTWIACWALAATAFACTEVGMLEGGNEDKADQNNAVQTDGSFGGAIVSTQSCSPIPYAPDLVSLEITEASEAGFLAKISTSGSSSNLNCTASDNDFACTYSLDSSSVSIETEANLRWDSSREISGEFVRTITACNLDADECNTLFPTGLPCTETDHLVAIRNYTVSDSFTAQPGSFSLAIGDPLTTCEEPHVPHFGFDLERSANGQLDMFLDSAQVSSIPCKFLKQADSATGPMWCVGGGVQGGLRTQMDVVWTSSQQFKGGLRLSTICVSEDPDCEPCTTDYVVSGARER